VRALGLAPFGEGSHVQVSTNIERWRECGPARVFSEVASRAPGLIDRIELVGLCPAQAWSMLLDRARDVPVHAAAHPTIEAHLP
jgi:hypothetical protein